MNALFTSFSLIVLASGLAAQSPAGAPALRPAAKPVDPGAVASWIRSMRDRLSTDLENLTKDRHYRWEEVSRDHQGTGEKTYINDFYFGDAKQWRLVHTADQGGLHRGRAGDVAWDLHDTTVHTFAAAFGRTRKPRKDEPADAPKPINTPLYGRLASLGYCLTGGLHLITAYNLTPEPLTVAADGAWKLRAGNDTLALEFEGTFRADQRTGRVQQVRFVRSTVPAQRGIFIRFRDWGFEEGIDGVVAGRVTSHNPDGSIYYERVLEPVLPIDLATLQALTTTPSPTEDDILLGNARVDTHYDFTTGAPRYYLWKEGAWSRFLAPEDFVPAKEDRLQGLGWLMGGVAFFHALWIRRRTPNVAPATA